MLNAEKKTCKYNEHLCKYYEQFKVYRDKVLALSNDSLEKNGSGGISFMLGLCRVGIACDGSFKTFAKLQQSVGHEEKHS
jgi:hypothetical protein